MILHWIIYIDDNGELVSVDGSPDEIREHIKEQRDKGMREKDFIVMYDCQFVKNENECFDNNKMLG
jgi:alkanesulfonate monooxygenase SsuD/methylene tetrahydromethanopterin reductase-like flavin-dependent oxidoreductase (luciferase family)